MCLPGWAGFTSSSPNEQAAYCVLRLIPSSPNRPSFNFSALNVGEASFVDTRRTATRTVQASSPSNLRTAAGPERGRRNEDEHRRPNESSVATNEGTMWMRRTCLMVLELYSTSGIAVVFSLVQIRLSNIYYCNNIAIE